MGTYGVLWGPMVTFAALWGPLGSRGDDWGAMGSFRDLWGHTATYGDLWGPMGPFSGFWLSNFLPLFHLGLMFLIPLIFFIFSLVGGMNFLHTHYDTNPPPGLRPPRILSIPYTPVYVSCGESLQGLHPPKIYRIPSRLV